MLSELYYTRLAAAAVRGSICVPPEFRELPTEVMTDAELEQLFDLGRSAGVKLYRFKKTHEDLPRVRVVLGAMYGICPESLLDIGSGRGVFLFPFLEAFPDCEVTSFDVLSHRVEFLQTLHRGGINRLTAKEADICTCDLEENSFDVVTLLEVLEHIPDVESAVQNACKAARRHVVVSVPSKPDNNPEHIHLLTKDRLTELFTAAGCTSLHFSGVPGHLIMVATKEV